MNYAQKIAARRVTAQIGSLYRKRRGFFQDPRTESEKHAKGVVYATLLQAGWPITQIAEWAHADTRTVASYAAGKAPAPVKTPKWTDF